MAGACKVRYAIEDIFWHHYRNLFFDLIFSVSNIYRNETAQKKGKSDDLSSLVGHRIEISNPFLKDLEVVILFVEWLESLSLSQREGTEGRECKYSRGLPDTKKRRNIFVSPF